MLRINNIKIRSDLKNEEVLDFALKKNKIKKEDPDRRPPRGGRG